MEEEGRWVWGGAAPVLALSLFGLKGCSLPSSHLSLRSAFLAVAFVAGPRLSWALT